MAAAESGGMDSTVSDMRKKDEPQVRLRRPSAA
jgi:hypothetical protein